MIKYSIVKNNNLVTALAHSEEGEFVGILDARSHPGKGLLEVQEIVSKTNTSYLMLKAIAIHAKTENLRLISNRTKDIRKRRDIDELSLWETMLNYKKTYFPEKLSNELILDTPHKSRNYSYTFPVDEMVERHLTTHNMDQLPSVLEKALAQSYTIRDYVLESKTSVYIEDKFELSQPNYNTGENILSGYDLKEIIEVYTSGKCMFLAIALSERFGFDIQMHISKYQKNWMIEHAWVASDSVGVDINGAQPGYNWDGDGKHKSGVTKDQIFQLMLASGEYPDFNVEKGNESIKDAHQAISNYLLKMHPEIEALTPCKEKYLPTELSI